MKSAILKISNDNISGIGLLIDFVIDSMCLLSAASKSHHLLAVIVSCHCVCWSM